LLEPLECVELAAELLAELALELDAHFEQSSKVLSMLVTVGAFVEGPTRT
jgi:hypothetical protein